MEWAGPGHQHITAPHNHIPCPHIHAAGVLFFGTKNMVTLPKLLPVTVLSSLKLV